MAKYDLKKKVRLGILGGTFDPAHKGHLKISKVAKKLFKLDKIVWAITEKNPFKSKSFYSLKKRVQIAKSLTKKTKYVTVGFYEKKIKSNKTIKLIKFFKKNRSNEIFFIMGADNLINFHKWNNWSKIGKLAKILVFDRSGYKKRSKESVAYKNLKKKGLKLKKYLPVQLKFYSKHRNASMMEISKLATMYRYGELVQVPSIQFSSIKLEKCTAVVNQAIMVVWVI